MSGTAACSPVSFWEKWRIMIDWSYIWTLGVAGLIILAVQMFLLFQDTTNRKDDLAFRSQPSVRQVLMEWMLYMLVFVVLASLIQAVLHLLCSYC